MEEINDARLRMHKRDRDKFDVLLRHSHFLRSALSLAGNRSYQYSQRCVALGYSDASLEPKAIRGVWEETTKGGGFIFEHINLESLYEVRRFYCGPAQIALCLAWAMKSKYERLSKNDSSFCDEEIDDYFNNNTNFFNKMKSTRNSLLHERSDNIYRQADISGTIDPNESILDKLFEYAKNYEAYLQRLLSSLAQNKIG